jgi:crossover junction endodeoxyribonuclease RuvC
MVFLGIDPGVERVGYAFVQREGSQLSAFEYGLIETPRVALSLRLESIYEEIRALIRKHNPAAAAIERVLFAVNKTTAMDVAKASGVLVLACRQAGIEVAEITPPEVKLAVVGHGGADKRQVQFMVAKLLGLKEPPKPDDVADALAIAIAHALSSRFASALEASQARG